MKEWQKAVKYAALGFAIFLSVSIISGILSAVAAFGGIFDFLNGNKDLVGDNKNYAVLSDISELNIKISAAELNIKTGDKFGIESNLKDLKVEEKNGKLTISQKGRWFNASVSSPVLNIYIPENTEFKTADIATGAGKVSIQNFQAEDVDLELGAGDVNISNLQVSKEIDIEGGAGSLKITSSSLSNLNLEMGVGTLSFQGKILGDSEISSGIGKVDISLIDDIYSVKLNKGIGKLTYNGKAAKNGETCGNGKNKLEINGGIGDTTVSTLTYIS